MNRASNLLLCLALGYGLCPAPASAQDPPQPAGLRFLVLDESPGGYALKDGDAFQPIISAPYRVSPLITPPDVRALDVYKELPPPPPGTGGVQRVRVASITPPTDTSLSLILLRPQPEAFQVEYIDCSPSTLPPGSLTILNRGMATLVVEIAGQTAAVPPGGQRTLFPHGDHRHRIRTRIATQTPEGWALISDGVVILRPDTRLVGLCVFSPSGLRERVGEDVIEKLGEPQPSHVWLTFSVKP